jgi:hypothetical protein
MLQRTTRALAIASFLLLMSTLAACGGGGTSPEPSSPTASTGTIPEMSGEASP